MSHPFKLVFAIAFVILNHAVVAEPANGQSENAPQRVQTPSTKQIQSVRKTKSKFKKLGGVVYRKINDTEIKCDVYIPRGTDHSRQLWPFMEAPGEREPSSPCYDMLGKWQERTTL